VKGKTLAQVKAKMMQSEEFRLAYEAEDRKERQQEGIEKRINQAQMKKPG
jgi:hypothetical protein